MRQCVVTSLIGLLLSSIAAAANPGPPYTIAYASFGPQNTAIYIADSDGTHERLLVGDPFMDGNVSFGPDGDSVLFSSRRNGSVYLYRVRIVGTHLERLTDDPSFDDQAALSPDGRRVAFVSSRSGQADIWILELTSKRLRNLTGAPGGDFRPAWSPDGKWIAFTSDRDSKGALEGTPRSSGKPFAPMQQSTLYVIRADGTRLRRLTERAVSAGSPAWSPDGKSIVFYEAKISDWRSMGTDFPGPAGTSQIVSLNVSSGLREEFTSGSGRKFAPKWIAPGRVAYLRGPKDEKRGQRQRVLPPTEAIEFSDGIASIPGNFSNVSWSRDRKRMVFHRAIEGVWPPLQPAFSRDPRFALVRAGVFPAYSPDGRKLAVNNGYAGNSHNSILVMNADGSDRRTIFGDPKASAVGPVWSPDGGRIAFGLGGFFLAARDGSPAHIGVVAGDGSALQMLTEGAGNYGFPSWSPDGKRVVCRSTVGMATHLVIVDVETRKVAALTSGPATDSLPSWSPKGDVIVFASDRDGDWELYSIKPDGTDLKRLTNSKGNDTHVSWSSDGRWIAFASARGGFKDEIPIGEGGGQGAGDIFVMRADGGEVTQLTDDAFEEATPAFAPRGQSR
jgi:TolB protein